MGWAYAKLYLEYFTHDIVSVFLLACWFVYMKKAVQPLPHLWLGIKNSNQEVLMYTM